MKKLITVLSITIIALSLTACNPTQEIANNNSSEIIELQDQTSAPAQTDIESDDTVSQDTETTNSETPSTTPSEVPSTTPSEVPSTPSSDAPVQTPSEDSENIPEEQPVLSEYFNDTNNTYDINSISIKPRYVYWKDGKLFAECFIINGFGHTVYNINVKSLNFNNGSVDIASGGFGVCNNLSLAPYTHTVWTFEFSADCVQNYGADLSRLICTSSVSNNY